MPTILRLDDQVGVDVLLGVHGTSSASSTIHDKLLLFLSNWLMCLLVLATLACFGSSRSCHETTIR